MVRKIRQELLETGSTKSKQVGGALPTNPVVRTEKGREEIVELGEFKANKPLDEHFYLVIKHNALFTALLPQLEVRLPLYAIVRNPLPVLASWQSVQLPVTAGTVPMGERFDAELATSLSEASGILQKQLIILNWFFERYRQCDPAHVISYENVIKTDGACLEVVTGKKTVVSPLEEQLTNSGLSDRVLRKLLVTLLDRPDIYEPFYTSADLQSKYLEMLH